MRSAGGGRRRGGVQAPKFRGRVPAAKEHGIHGLPAKRRAGEVRRTRRGALHPRLSCGLQSSGQQRLHHRQPVDGCGELREAPGCDPVSQRPPPGGGGAEVPLPGGDGCLRRLPPAAQLYA